MESSRRVRRSMQQSIEIRSLPTLTHCFPRNFTLITRTAPCLRQLPWLRCRLPARLKLVCFPALTHVLPPTSTSRFCPSMSLAPPRLHSHRYPPRLCLLCRFPQTLHSLTRDVFFVADSSVPFATRRSEDNDCMRSAGSL